MATSLASYGNMSSNSTCAQSAIPGRESTPDGYQALSQFGNIYRGDFGRQWSDDFAQYDELANTTWPVVVHTRHRGEDGELVQRAQVVCLAGGSAGGEFTEGTRRPEDSGGSEDDEDDGEDDSGASGKLLAAMALVQMGFASGFVYLLT